MNNLVLYLILCLVVGRGRVTGEEWRCADCQHITSVKARILNQLGLPASSFASYDIVWPVLPYRHKRTFLDDPFYPEAEHFMSMSLFGRRLTAYLNPSNITSSSACFFRGRVETCEREQCTIGKAAVSDCSDRGIFGYFQVDNDGVALSPLPSVIATASQDAIGGHLAKLIEPLQMWDDIPAIEAYVKEQNDKQQRERNHFLPTFKYSPLLDAFFPLPLPARYSTLSAPDMELSTKETGQIEIKLRIFVDKDMVDILDKKYGDVSSEQLTSVLSAINAVQTIYDDTSLGPVGVRLSVEEVAFEREGEAQSLQLGDGNAEEYLTAFCNGQDSLLTAQADVTMALTGLDLYGLLNNINKDKVYSGLAFKNNKIYGVTGLSYTGGACRQNRNCMVVEFRKEMENVETIAHELGHALGMNHDGTNNDCDSFAGKIMSLSVVRQRSGWSTCSAESFQSFLQKRGSCLLKINQGPSRKISQ
ncbi:hypothetical protein RvY_03661 [Ramazzottius varieornatus]|uniref:Peptidase M12B domain-containing protein n=1 Tax=Ramazzottius varieornatus TaxID=947166 RepID=A0A1D1UY84_RAMVA|nr:hypothetical protein RvY_03661 [Ramazzottius varieornatus]